ncbi:SRPBCC family protein [Nocardioides sp. Root151]|uniref:SRPBCC family protein n=1 Tax=Nocardioides sp. Root151 TaxID=1736475 RepID=UPI0007028646|nr:SRPBCC family protein [Nocardioides sp. Root151]KQZ68831.1 hypothetical protein ASD66_16360 [Nocardioides sp. Root151]
MVIHDEIFIAAPPERVWELTEDVEGWPALTPTMTSVGLTSDGPLGPGSTARVKQPRLPSATWTVTDLDPPRRFAWQTRCNGVLMTGSHEIEPTGGGCRNRLSLELEGPGAGALATVARPVLHKAIATENDGFRRAAEGLNRPTYVDEHRVDLDVQATQAWPAVVGFAEHLTGQEHALLSRALGLEPAAGFSVTQREAPRILGLTGRHRFSRYALDFRLVDVPGGSELSAVTYADFPGPLGFAYRSAVIGTRGHVLAVRRMLRKIAATANGDVKHP